MTIAQIITLGLAAPLGLICFLKLVFTLVYKHVNDFGLFEAVLLVACTLAIIVAFVGVR